MCLTCHPPALPCVLYLLNHRSRALTAPGRGAKSATPGVRVPRPAERAREPPARRPPLAADWRGGRRGSISSERGAPPSGSRGPGILRSLPSTPPSCPASRRVSARRCRPVLVAAPQQRGGPGRRCRAGQGGRGPAAPSRPPKRCGRRAPAAKTPRILYRGKSGSSSKMGRQGLGGAGAAGRSMQRSQSRSSLTASFEALAGYFPCMNSLEEDEGGEPLAGVSVHPSRLREVRGCGLARGARTRRAAVPLPAFARGTAGARDPQSAQPSQKLGSLVLGELHMRWLGERPS